MSELLRDEKIFYSEIRDLLQQSRIVAYKAVNTVFPDFDQLATQCVANLTMQNKNDSIAFTDLANSLHCVENLTWSNIRLIKIILSR